MRLLPPGLQTTLNLNGRHKALTQRRLFVLQPTNDLRDESLEVEVAAIHTWYEPDYDRWRDGQTAGPLS